MLIVYQQETEMASWPIKLVATLELELAHIAVIVRIRGYFDVIWQNSRFLPWGGLNEAYLRYL